MASAEVRAFFNKMREETENKTCVDCGTNNPQWASVPFGVLFCLECAGVHRSLGVHIDFVRSVPMDSWSEKQLAHMRVGGNKKFKDFFRQHKLLNSSIKDRYSSHAAEVYKQMIKTLSEGQPWTPPPGFSATSTPPSSTSSSTIRGSARLQSTPSSLAKGRVDSKTSTRKPKAQTVAADSWEDEWNDIQVSSLTSSKYSSPSLSSLTSSTSAYDQTIRSSQSSSPVAPSTNGVNSHKPKRKQQPRAQKQPQTQQQSSFSDSLSLSLSDESFRSGQYIENNDNNFFDNDTHNDSYNHNIPDSYHSSPPKPSYLLPSDTPLTSSSSLSSSNSPSVSPLSLSTNQPSTNESIINSGYDLFNKISSAAYNAATYSTKVASEKIESLSNSLQQQQQQQQQQQPPPGNDYEGITYSNKSAGTWDYVASYLQTATDTIKQLTVQDGSNNPSLANNSTNGNYLKSTSYGTQNYQNGNNSRTSKPQSFQIEGEWFENTSNSNGSKSTKNHTSKAKTGGWDGFEVDDHENELDDGKNSEWDDSWDDWGNDNIGPNLSTSNSGPKSRNKRI